MGELLSVLDPTTLRLEASVPAEDIGGVKPGTPVQFTVSGFEDRRFTGEVERVLGRPGRTYAEWVADHAAAFRNEQQQ